MKDFFDNSNDVSIQDIKNGFSFDDESKTYSCLSCKKETIEGYVYKETDLFTDAKKTMENHVKNTHGDIFQNLVSMDKKFSDLTEQQKNILLLFYNNFSDIEISKKLGGVTAANIRNFRYYFQKKEKQAKIFLSIMDLLKEKKSSDKSKDVNVTSNSKLDRYFKNNKLIKFPKNIEDKNLVYHSIIKNFSPDRSYSEKEINNILNAFNDDFALLRRELVVHEFFTRKEDGSMYNVNIKDTTDKSKRKSLVEEYLNTEKYAGVYQIKNTVNNKIFIGTSPDLKAKKNSIFFSLESGGIPFKNLQNEFKEFGRESFEFSILEDFKTNEMNTTEVKEKLKKSEEKWLKELNPFEDKGYNAKPRDFK